MSNDADGAEGLRLWPMALNDAREIPTITLSGLRSGRRADLERIGNEIGQAARGLGFFSVAGHGIDPAQIDAVFARSRAFFTLPQSEKDHLSVANSTSYRGYVKLGEEKLDTALAGDVKECFNVGPDLAADDPRVLAGEPYHAVNQWPALPGFRAPILAFAAAALELVVLLQRAIAVDLGLDERFFDEHFSAAVGVLRLLHYPPHPGTFDGSLYGAGAHTDYGNLTLLAQDETGGLEVRRRDGTWVPVAPQPGTFVCNIGDCLMRWTNDIYVSNAHRVVNRSGRERYSIAYFFDPNPEARVEAIPSCVAAGAAPLYPPVLAADYLKMRLDASVPAM